MLLKKLNTSLILKVLHKCLLRLSVNTFYIGVCINISNFLMVLSVGKGEKKKKKKVVKVKKKNKINTEEVPIVRPQPVDLSATFGETQPLV